MVSKTKYPVESSTVRALFLKAGFDDVSDIKPLGKGEFNAVFSANASIADSSEAKGYVMKIAPPDNIPVMTYEKNMMETEIYWYETAVESTPVKTPKIYYSDFSKSSINTSYFIMDKIEGLTLDQFPKDRKEEADKQIAIITGYLHNVKGIGYGYVQNGLKSNWYEAIRSMTEAVVGDCAEKNKSPEKGEKLLGYIDRYKDVLIGADSRMVSFDLWQPNVIHDGANFVWIDPERGFWGDPVMDLVCLEPMRALEEKTISLNAHNEVSDLKIEITLETSIRYGIALAYLALIMDTERYYRYSPVYKGWWRNILASKMMYTNAFNRLERH